MHSEQTLQHLQHMVTRVSSGVTGEEKEIINILYDEIYTLVRPVYIDDERSKKVAHIILNKYVSKLPGRQVFDVISDVHLYAIRCMYNTMKKESDSDALFLDNGITPYPYRSVSDDNKFYRIVAEYDDVFISVNAYNQMPQSFQKMEKQLIILMELFCFEECSVSYIAEFLNVPEQIIRQNLTVLRQKLFKIYRSLQPKKDTEMELEHQEIKQKVQQQKIEEDDFLRMTDIILPNLQRKYKTMIDMLLAIIILIAGVVLAMM